MGEVCVPEVVAVPVPGGDLCVLCWPAPDPAAPTVLAAHGITSNALAWARVAAALAGSVTLVAPDLRGRAGSAAVAGPYGMAAHAHDLVAVLDRLRLDRAVLVGHSMGAFAVAVTAVRAPHRVSSVVLVDGGVGFPVPEGADLDAVLLGVLGPAMERLSRIFTDREAHRQFWRSHPAVGPAFDAMIAAHVDRDLVGEEPELRSSCSLAAVRADGADLLSGARTLRAVHELIVPATLLWAPRGLRDEPTGLYTASRLVAAGLDPGRVRVERVDDVNHYTIVLGDRGAEAVAAAVRAAVEAPA
jgi:pimeloyl-ACP methyl ester carboxylesterase